MDVVLPKYRPAEVVPAPWPPTAAGEAGMDDKAQAPRYNHPQNAM